MSKTLRAILTGNHGHTLAMQDEVDDRSFVVSCLTCGAWSGGDQPKRLIEPCRHRMHSGDRHRLRLLARGLHPRAGRVLGEPTLLGSRHDLMAATIARLTSDDCGDDGLAIV